jgi:hypothetical protein
MEAKWCSTCREFVEGTGDCPECGSSRRQYQAVRMKTGDTRKDIRSDAPAMPNNHNYRRNR